MNETNLSLKYLIDQLHKEQTLTKEEWITLIEGHTPELSEYLFSLAREERQEEHNRPQKQFMEIKFMSAV